MCVFTYFHACLGGRGPKGAYSGLSYGPDIATRVKLIPVCNPGSEIEVQAAAEKVKDSDLKVRINSTIPWVKKMLTGTP